MRRLTVLMVLFGLVFSVAAQPVAAQQPPGAVDLLKELRKVAVSVDAQHDNAQAAIDNTDMSPDDQIAALNQYRHAMVPYIEACKVLLRQIQDYGRSEYGTTTYNNGQMLLEVELNLLHYISAEAVAMSDTADAISNGASYAQQNRTLNGRQRQGTRADFLALFNALAEAWFVPKLY